MARKDDREEREAAEALEACRERAARRLAHRRMPLSKQERTALADLRAVAEPSMRVSER